MDLEKKKNQAYLSAIQAINQLIHIGGYCLASDLCFDCRKKLTGLHLSIHVQ